MSRISLSAAWEEGSRLARREASLLLPVVFGLISLPLAAANFATPLITGRPGGPLLFLLLLLALVTALAAGQVALFRLLLTPGTSVGEAIRRGAARLPAMIAVFLLAGAAFLLILLVTVTVSMVASGVAPQPGAGLTPAAVRAGTIGMLLALPPMLYLFARFVFAIAFAAQGPGGPVALLRRSWALTRGHSGKLYGFVLLVFLLGMVLRLAAQLGPGLLVLLAAGPPDPGSLSILLMFLINACVGTLITTYAAAMTARIFVQLGGEAGETSGS